jgi:hypothetical protein
MSEELVIMILGFVLIQWRLDRLSKQCEAQANPMMLQGRLVSQEGVVSA